MLEEFGDLMSSLRAASIRVLKTLEREFWRPRASNIPGIPTGTYHPHALAAARAARQPA